MLTLVNLCCNQYPKTLETRPSFHNHPPNTLRSRNSLKKKKKKNLLVWHSFIWQRPEYEAGTLTIIRSKNKISYIITRTRPTSFCLKVIEREIIARSSTNPSTSFCNCGILAIFEAALKRYDKLSIIDKSHGMRLVWPQ